MPNDPTGPTCEAAAELELEADESVALPLEEPESLVAEASDEVDDCVVVTVAFPGTVAMRLMVDDRVLFGDTLERDDSVVVVTTPVSSVEVDVGSGTVEVAVGTEDVVMITPEVLAVEHVWPALMAEQKLDAAGRTCSVRGLVRLISMV